jgi:hypothetical protein
VCDAAAHVDLPVATARPPEAFAEGLRVFVRDGFAHAQPLLEPGSAVETETFGAVLRRLDRDYGARGQRRSRTTAVASSVPSLAARYPLRVAMHRCSIWSTSGPATLIGGPSQVSLK